MKLLSRTTLYLSVAFAVIMAAWAFLFYLSMLDEIYDSIDDGLDNYKLLIIEKARRDPAILQKREFDEGNYAVFPILAGDLTKKDNYMDTLMYMKNEDDFEPVRLLRTTFYHDGQYYNLQVITSMVEEDDLIADLLAYLIVLYALIVSSIIIVNHVILRRLWRPFHNILSQLKDFDLRDPAPLKHDDSRIREFSEMAHAVSGLLKNNIDRYNSQRHFIENASHELQTPLTIAINKLELLLEDPTLNQKQGEELAGLLETLHRLTRLNKALILITNIENKHFIEVERLDIGEIIKKTVDDLSPYAEHKKVGLALLRESEFSVRINRDLATIMVTNLIRNALLHNREVGSVNITVTENSFSIANTSDSGQLDNGKLFTRFYRQKQKVQSLGLGLSIVKEICKLNGLQINYRYYNSRHEFVVNRPA